MPDWRAERQCNDRAVISRLQMESNDIAVTHRYVCVYGRWVEFVDIPNPQCCMDDALTVTPCQDPTP